MFVLLSIGLYRRKSRLWYPYLHWSFEILLLTGNYSGSSLYIRKRLLVVSCGETAWLSEEYRITVQKRRDRRRWWGNRRVFQKVWTERPQKTLPTHQSDSQRERHLGEGRLSQFVSSVCDVLCKRRWAQEVFQRSQLTKEETRKPTFWVVHIDETRKWIFWGRRYVVYAYPHYLSPTSSVNGGSGTEEGNGIPFTCHQVTPALERVVVDVDDQRLYPMLFHPAVHCAHTRLMDRPIKTKKK